MFVRLPDGTRRLVALQGTASILFGRDLISRVLDALDIPTTTASDLYLLLGKSVVREDYLISLPMLQTLHLCWPFRRWQEDC